MAFLARGSCSCSRSFFLRRTNENWAVLRSSTRIRRAGIPLLPVPPIASTIRSASASLSSSILYPPLPEKSAITRGSNHSWFSTSSTEFSDADWEIVQVPCILRKYRKERNIPHGSELAVSQFLILCVIVGKSFGRWTALCQENRNQNFAPTLDADRSRRIARKDVQGRTHGTNGTTIGNGTNSHAGK
jgi:hypothetical protein